MGQHRTSLLLEPFSLPRRAKQTGIARLSAQFRRVARYRQVRTALAAAAVCAVSQIGLAFQSSPPVIKVCSLLPREEVKKLIGGDKIFDMFAPEEEAVAGGSSCNYPGVMVQVIPFRQSWIDTVRKSPPVEAVSGVGDEAYLHDNPGT